ncbi:MAG: hypothetical protein RJA34_3350, partial [Pseudomonadota bacterium]
MPLPPAPTKRAALLSQDAFKETTKSSSRPARKVNVSMDAAKVQESLQAPAPITSVDRSTDKRTGPAQTGKNQARKETGRAKPVAENSRTTRARAPQAVPHTQSQATPVKSPKSKRSGLAKLFVLDTNVLLHDPMCLFRFEEHDIYLPMIVLEELDAHKKGMTEVARNARQTSRTLDALAATNGTDISLGLKLDTTGHREAEGKLFFQTQPLNYTLPTSLPQGKADNQILGVVDALRAVYAPREVVLVSKDINMRVKARALGLLTEDYQNDKTLEDGDLLYSGALALPADFWGTHGQTVESWQQNAHTFYRVSGPVVPQMMINQFVFFEAPGEPSLYARVTEIRGETAVFKTLKDYNHLKNAVWGITTRNREQNFAMNLLMDPEVDFVTLTGTAGTGKTLMALAAGLTQVLDDRRYTEII